MLRQKVAHREYVDAQKVDAAFFDFPNGASLELVCPRGNAGLEKFLDKRGDALHHLALRVKDIDGVLQLPKFRKDRLPFVTTLEECPESMVDRALADVARSDYHVQPPLALPIFV